MIRPLPADPVGQLQLVGRHREHVGALADRGADECRRRGRAERLPGEDLVAFAADLARIGRDPQIGLRMPVTVQEQGSYAAASQRGGHLREPGHRGPGAQVPAVRVEHVGAVLVGPGPDRLVRHLLQRFGVHTRCPPAGVGLHDPGVDALGQLVAHELPRAHVAGQHQDLRVHALGDVRHRSGDPSGVALPVLLGRTLVPGL
jgi:hypothetical protein